MRINKYECIATEHFVECRRCYLSMLSVSHVISRTCCQEFDNSDQACDTHSVNLIEIMMGYFLLSAQHTYESSLFVFLLAVSFSGNLLTRSCYMLLRFVLVDFLKMMTHQMRESSLQGHVVRRPTAR